MESVRKELALVVMTVVLLLALAVGSLAPGLAAAVTQQSGEAATMWAAPQDVLAMPYGGGGSGS